MRSSPIPPAPEIDADARRFGALRVCVHLESPSSRWRGLVLARFRSGLLRAGQASGRAGRSHRLVRSSLRFGISCGLPSSCAAGCWWRHRSAHPAAASLPRFPMPLPLPCWPPRSSPSAGPSWGLHCFEKWISWPCVYPRNKIHRCRTIKQKLAHRWAMGALNSGRTARRARRSPTSPDVGARQRKSGPSVRPRPPFADAPSCPRKSRRGLSFGPIAPRHVWAAFERGCPVKRPTSA